MARSRYRIATRAKGSSDDAAEAASATIRRLRPLRPVPGRLHTRPPPLLALPTSATSATAASGKRRITNCVHTTAFQNSSVAVLISICDVATHAFGKRHDDVRYWTQSTLLHSRQSPSGGWLCVVRNPLLGRAARRHRRPRKTGHASAPACAARAWSNRGWSHPCPG